MFCLSNSSKLFPFALCLILISWSVGANNHEAETLSTFLESESFDEKFEAFSNISSNKNRYQDVVFRELQKYQGNIHETPDDLIYLAAYIKDQKYMAPLMILLNDPDYSWQECIYDCAIVFSLVIFGAFTDIDVPIDESSKLTAVGDFQSELRRVRSLELKEEKASDYVKGPGIDSALNAMESLPLDEVIRKAGPFNENTGERMVAAFVLNYGTSTSEYLDDLYWLAITGYDDASSQYLGAIHQAIYRAETARYAN